VDTIIRALSVVTEYHSGQPHKAGGAPCLLHVLDVIRLLLAESGISEDVVIAGILHDTLEDSGKRNTADKTFEE
jgi:(p)ppGpp synthase/HD superfamily hydrolase